MKGSFILKAVLFLALGTAMVCSRAGAQTIALRVTDTPDPVATNAILTYTIGLTNVSISPQNFFVTNTLPASAPIISASITQGTVVTNGTTAVFDLGAVLVGFGVEMTVQVRPSTAGPLVNTIDVSTTFTNFVTTNITTTVTGGGSPPTNNIVDLAVSIADPLIPPLANDWMTYTVSVTNSGGSVSGVFLTNTLPAGVGFIRLSPANQSFTTGPGRVVLNLGTLTNGFSRTFGMVVQPTNAGTFAFVSRIAGSSIADSNTVNNVASNNITVSPFVAGQFSVSNVSAMVYNPQTGLMEQTVRLTNTGSTNAETARVIVLGIPAGDRLFNAVGTNNANPAPNGNPFVIYSAPLGIGEEIDLLMEYFVPSRTPIEPEPTYVGVGAPAFDLEPGSGTNAAFSITLMTNLPPDGRILIEFESIPGRHYTVLYSTNMDFSDVHFAMPPIQAHANRMQWIDDGPPKTVRHPSADPSRAYRVLLINP